MRLSCLLIIAAMAFAPQMLFAQFEMPEPQNVKAAYSADGTSLRVQHQEYSANINLGTAADHQVFLRGKWGEYHTAGTGYFPRYLYEASVSAAAFSQKGSVFLFADSKSDKPYHSSKETDFGFNFFRNIEPWSNERSTWMFMLNYSSRRTFWKGIPIPFLAYRYMSEKFMFIAPFFGEYKFAPQFSVNAAWIPLYQYRAGLKWQPSKEFKAELANGIGADQFLVAGREKEDDALYIRQYYLSLSSEWQFCKKAALSAGIGYVFRSSFYYGDGYSDVNGEEKTGNGLSGSLGLKLFF
ncbi:MAG: hypothetical protein J5706_02625 [Elusimicrobiales bacterium]|nr:hypothetical protein [Elusimicrobiales bacterium]